MYIIAGIDIENFVKARNKFEEFRKDMITDRDKAGAIQAFEYSYELAWKMMKRILANRGVIEITSPRDCFRESAAAGLISDPKIWFEFIKVRNITVHTYNEENIELVISVFDKFSAALSELLGNITKLK